jgi:prephenate dehydrogenase
LLTSPDPAAWQIVAGGFRDTSRVAGSDVRMMLDILLTNREAVLESVATCQTQLAELAQLIEAGDEGELGTALGLIQEKRKEMFP